MYQFVKALRDRRDNPVWWGQQSFLRRVAAEAVARFDPAAIIAPRLRLRGSLPEKTGGPILMAACDEIYFYRFARMLAMTARERSPGTAVHLHVFDPSPLCLMDMKHFADLLPGITFSHEDRTRDAYAEPSAFFYAAGRFAVAARILSHCERPVLLVDADSLVRAPLDKEIAALAPNDFGLIFRSHRSQLYRKILASAIYLAPTPGGRRFAALTAAAVEAAIATAPPYHVDQALLHLIENAIGSKLMFPKVTSLSRRWSDHTFDDDALIWSAKGPRKAQFPQLSRQTQHQFAKIRMPAAAA